MKKSIFITLMLCSSKVFASSTTPPIQATCYTEKPIEIEVTWLPNWLFERLSWKYKEYFLIKKMATEFPCTYFTYENPMQTFPSDPTKMVGANGTVFDFGQGRRSSYAISSLVTAPLEKDGKIGDEVTTTTFNGESFKSYTDTKTQATCYRSLSRQFCFKHTN